MTEEVTVLENMGNGEVVVGCSTSECQGCHCSFFCNRKTSTFEAINPKNIELERGDKVVLHLPEGKTMFSVFLSLGFPLLMFFPGYFIGRVFTLSEVLLLVWGLSFIALGFAITGLYFRLRRKNYLPAVKEKVVKSVEKNEEGERHC